MSSFVREMLWLIAQGQVFFLKHRRNEWLIIYQSNSTHFLNLFGIVQRSRRRLLDQDATNNLIHGKTKSGWISTKPPACDTEIEIRPLHLQFATEHFWMLPLLVAAFQT